MNRYVKAIDLLPKELYNQVLPYCQGMHLYFPTPGTQQRNIDIYNKRMEGVGVKELAEQYELSTPHINKIVREIRKQVE